MSSAYYDLIPKLIEIPFFLLCAFLIKGFILSDMIWHNQSFLSSLETLYLLLELSESCHVTVTVSVWGISEFLCESVSGRPEYIQGGQEKISLPQYTEEVEMISRSLIVIETM